MEKRFDLRSIPPGMTVRSTVKKGLDYLKATGAETPILLMDREKIEHKASLIGRHIQRAEVFYAVKANPHPDVLAVLAAKGLGFEIASEGELKILREIGVTADRMITSNPLKTPLFLREAAREGVGFYAIDSRAEIEKMAVICPGANVYVRVSVPNEGSEWPLSRKFGVEPDEAFSLLRYAAEKGLTPVGTTFHVGSQCGNPNNWDSALEKTARIWEEAEKAGIRLSVLNLGGGYPIHYTKDVVTIEEIERRVDKGIKKLFPEDTRVMIEPGRGMVGDAGIFITSVTGKANRLGEYWMYIDVGVFNGLMEAVGGIRYSYLTEGSGPVRRWILSGPSCDSFDVIDKEVELPEPEVGDRMIILGAGAYTISYASEFNGFSIPRTIVI